MHFMRGRLKKQDDKWTVTPSPHQAAHVISSLANADCLVAVPECQTLKHGTLVPALVIA